MISTYQAVSGTGKAAVDGLREESQAVLDGGARERYPHPIAFNVLAQAAASPPATTTLTRSAS